MKWVFVIRMALLLAVSYLSGRPAQALPASRATSVVIDSAPSVVVYQGSGSAKTQAHTQAHVVVAPMGRALGYVQPLGEHNRTLHRSEQIAATALDVLDISPVYVKT